jgi:16S rRNA (adenine1518-N6/adenine1519-N6)-dimethyltransferase
MTADPDTADYGRLTVMLQAKFRIVRLFVVPGARFGPRRRWNPRLRGSTPCTNESRDRDEALFARVVAAAFAQRRKTLRNASRRSRRAADGVSIPRTETLASPIVSPRGCRNVAGVADFERYGSRTRSSVERGASVAWARPAFYAKQQRAAACTQ